MRKADSKSIESKASAKTSAKPTKEVKPSNGQRKTSNDKSETGDPTKVPSAGKMIYNTAEDNVDAHSSDEEEFMETKPRGPNTQQEKAPVKDISKLINPERDPDPTWDIYDDKEAPLQKGALGIPTDDLDLSSIEVVATDTTNVPVSETKQEPEEIVVAVEEETKEPTPTTSAGSWNISLYESTGTQEIKVDRELITDEIMKKRKLVEKSRKRNVMLNALMVNYYTNNKMENAVLQPDDEDPPMFVDKYLDKLFQFCEREKEFDKYEKSCEEYLQEKSAIRMEKKAILDNEISKMTSREKTIATGLLSSRTGNVLPDKVIDRLIKRQSQAMRSVTQWTIRFLKIRDRVNIMDAKVKAIECIGEGLRLTDYEDMMLESNNSMEKIEEKEEELLNLRRRCNEATQMLAHMREKQFAVEGDIVTGKKTVENLRADVADIRKRITNHRKEKVKARGAIEKIKDRNALLFKRPLLCDFAACVEKEATMRAELQRLKQEFEEGRARLLTLRKSLPGKHASSKSSKSQSSSI